MSPSSLKDKRSTIADMAKMLGLAYVIDGSVRKSGSRLRVVARLLHAEDEYVVWSETYDRPLDLLRIQDEIAGEVAKALRASISPRTPHSDRILISHSPLSFARQRESLVPPAFDPADHFLHGSSEPRESNAGLVRTIALRPGTIDDEQRVGGIVGQVALGQPTMR
jgi:hypothetical protein